MEFLKRIIRNALQAKATVISIVEGSGVQFRQNNNTVSSGGENPVPRVLLDECFKFLLKRSSENEALAKGEYVDSKFNITQLGDVMVIAVKNDQKNSRKWELHLYLPPNGTAQFSADLQQFRNKSASSKDANNAPAAKNDSINNIFSLQTMGHSMTAVQPALSENPQAAGVNQRNVAQPSMSTPPPPVPVTEPASPATSSKDGNVNWLPKFSSEPEIESFALKGKEPDIARSGAPTAAPITTKTPNVGSNASGHQDFIPKIPIPSFDEEADDATADAEVLIANQELMPDLSQTFHMPDASNELPEIPMPVLKQPHVSKESIEHQNFHEEPPMNVGYSPAHRTPPVPPPIEIDFDADAGAKGAISNGQNPIDAVLKIMVQNKASDLHLTTGEPICMRIDGEIHRINTEAVSKEQMAQFVLPILPERNRAEFQEINDTDFAYEIAGLSRFRVNVFRDKNGVGMVLRNIPSQILTAEQLNLPPIITKFCNLGKGLVVVTGPTGSGKSTTLAAMVDLINKTRSDHILTIEDPVEFVHPQQKCLVNQREVHKHTQSFARALKAALREDPDIVLIGEMRDLETVAIAIETAETGHLVFGTLHTTTAVSTVDRIIDQFPSDQQEQIRMMLASSLKGVVAQTLLKKKGGGRVAAHEILVVNDAVSAMIREGKNHMIPNHMQTQKVEGNILLNESLTRLVRENLVEPEEAIKKAVDKTSLIDGFRRLGIKLPPMYGGPQPTQPQAGGAPLSTPHKQSA